MDVVTKENHGNTVIFWLPLLILIIHSTDEFVNGFPAWATDHFGVTTPAFFVYTHIFLVLLVATISYLATRRGLFWKMLAVVAMMQFATNGLFHIVTTFLFGEIAPGLFTALFVSLPVSYVFFRAIFKHHLLPKKQIVLSMVVGFVAALLIIATLWLEGGIGWGFSLVS